MVVAVVDGIRGPLAEVDAIGECGRDIESGDVLAKILSVGVGEIFADADLLRQGTESAVARGDAHDEEGSRSESLDATADVAVEPVDDSRDGNHARHADDDSQNRKRGSDLARSYGVQGYQQVFPKCVSAHSYSARSATTGSSFEALVAG